jgi:hypothetical protein
MSFVGRIDVSQSDFAPSNAESDLSNARNELFGAPLGAFWRSQETPRAWRSNNDLLAITRLASPKRLNSCASFLAMPL